MAWLLDTNVLSELRRPKPEPRVVDFVSKCPLDQLYVSAVTLAEIRFGIELVDEPNRRADRKVMGTRYALLAATKLAGAL
jgi:predicted nucleic acid-binding protein